MALNAVFAVRADDIRSGLAEEFFSQAPDGWSKLAAASTRVDGAASFRKMVTTSHEAKTERSWETAFRFNGEHVLFESGKPDGDRNLVVGINPLYTFVLRRRTAGDSLVLDYVGGDRLGAMDHLETKLFPFLHAPWMTCNKPFARLIREPGFRLIGISEVTAPRRLVRVDFQYTPAPEEKTAIRGGTLTLMPDLCWGLASMDLKTPWGSIEEAVEYGDLVGNVPGLRSVVERMVASNGIKRVETYCTITQWDYREVPAEKFTLTAFGMSEPPSGRAAGGWDHGGMAGYLFLALGGILAVAATYLRYGQGRASARGDAGAS